MEPDEKNSSDQTPHVSHPKTKKQESHGMLEIRDTIQVHSTIRAEIRCQNRNSSKRRRLLTSCIHQNFSSIFDSLDEIRCHHSYWTRMISRVSSETSHAATECRTSPTCLAPTASRAVLRLSSDAWNVLLCQHRPYGTTACARFLSSYLVTCSSIRLCSSTSCTLSECEWVLAVTLCSLFALTLWPLCF